MKKKYRINLTVEDYFDWVGTNPNLSRRDRMIESLPEEFNKGYNIKFKTLKDSVFYWKTVYRVHLSLITTEEEIQNVINRYKSTSFITYKITYKEIKKWEKEKVHW